MDTDSKEKDASKLAEINIGKANLTVWGIVRKDKPQEFEAAWHELVVQFGEIFYIRRFLEFLLDKFPSLR